MRIPSIPAVSASRWSVTAPSNARRTERRSITSGSQLPVAMLKERLYSEAWNLFEVAYILRQNIKPKLKRSCSAPLAHLLKNGVKIPCEFCFADVQWVH